MNLAIFIIMAVACFALAILNGFFQDREKPSGLIFNIVTPLSFLVFAIISGNLASNYNALYLSLCIAIAFYVATEACAKHTKAEMILKGLLNIGSLVLLVLGSISLAPFTFYGLLGGFLLGAGFGFTVFVVSKDCTLTKKIICFVEFLFGGVILGCSFSSVISSTHLISAVLYLVGAVLLFARYFMRGYFGKYKTIQIISRIVFGLSMICIISSIFFY